MGSGVPARTPQNAKPARTHRAAVALLAATGSLSGQERPNELLMLSWGRNQTRKGLFIVNERTVACLRANQDVIGRPRVMGDFEHASVDEDPAKHPMRFGSAGQPVASPEHGLRIVEVEWKPAGIEHVPVDYPDLSVAPIYDETTREIIGVHSYAHCRHGAADVATYENSLEPALAALNARVAALSADFTPQTKDKPMPENELLCALLAKLGITCDAATATAEQLTAAAAEGEAKITALQAAAGKADAAPVAELSAKLATLTATVEKLTANHAQATRLSAFHTMLDTALNEGRLVTLSADDLMILGETRAKAHIATCPAGTVPMERRTPAIARLNASPLTAGPHTDEARALADLGVTLRA